MSKRDIERKLEGAATDVLEEVVGNGEWSDSQVRYILDAAYEFAEELKNHNEE